jgi:hypothetical protein
VHGVAAGARVLLYARRGTSKIFERSSQQELHLGAPGGGVRCGQARNVSCSVALRNRRVHRRPSRGRPQPGEDGRLGGGSARRPKAEHACGVGIPTQELVNESATVCSAHDAR